MNTIMNMDPLSLLDEMLGVDRPMFRTMRARMAGHFPPVNVFLDDTAVIVDLELPGKTSADVDLSLEPQVVIIADKTTAEKTTPTWSRRLELPFRVNAEKANAKFTDGILRIELPKADAPTTRKITIQ